MKKNWKTIVVTITVTVAVTVALLLWLASYQPVFVMQSPTFSVAEQINIELGFSEKAITENATYYIEDELADKNLDYIRYYEILLTTADTRYDLRASHPQIYITDKNEGKKYYGKSIILNPEELYANGKLFYMLSNKKLPMWLCVGLENYWLSYYGETSISSLSKAELTDWMLVNEDRGLPIFGDAWFIPNFIEGASIKEAQAVAFTLTQRIIETGAMTDLLAQQDNKQAFQTAVNDALKGFLTWRMYNIEQPVYTFLGQEFSVTTLQCEYTFEQGKWRYDKISECVPVMDDAIRYVKRFLQSEYEKPLQISINYDEQEAIPYSGVTEPHTNKISINGFHDDYATIVVHESTHALTDSQAFPVFVEGLATMIQAHYDMDYKSANYHLLLREYLDYHNGIYNEEVEKAFQLYDERTSGTYKQNYIDLYVLRDVSAYLELSDDDFPKSSYINYGTSILSQKDTYRQVGSFLQFLYNRYGLEKIMRVYYDFDLFEEIFDLSLEKMVMQWKASVGM